MHTLASMHNSYYYAYELVLEVVCMNSLSQIADIADGTSTILSSQKHLRKFETRESCAAKKRRIAAQDAGNKSSPCSHWIHNLAQSKITTLIERKNDHG